jgi:hypothetical protein
VRIAAGGSFTSVGSPPVPRASAFDCERVGHGNGVILMLDIIVVASVLALFALLGLLVRGVERL